MRRGKFNAVPTILDGVRFDSKSEAARWSVLRAREAAGEIANLSRQRTYPLVINGVKLGSYRSDFEYDRDGCHVTEDAKSCATAKLATFTMKKKLMLALYGITIYVTLKPDAP